MDSLMNKKSISMVLLTEGTQAMGRIPLTNSVAISQFPVGTSAMPLIRGSVSIIYSNVMKLGASIVTQAILPGMFQRDSTEVLPMGYQSVSHCIDVSCRHGQPICCT